MAEERTRYYDECQRQADEMKSGRVDLLRIGKDDKGMRLELKLETHSFQHVPYQERTSRLIHETRIRNYNCDHAQQPLGVPMHWEWTISFVSGGLLL
eukprot:4280050-Amphidinium_carterae.1